MRLRLVTISLPPGVGERLAAELDSGLSVLAFDSQDSRALFSDALFAAVGGPVGQLERPNSSISSESSRKRWAHSIFALGRAKSASHASEIATKCSYSSAYIDYESSDGRSLGILRDLVGGTATIVDLDTNERVDVTSPPVPGSLPFEVFESLVRVKAPDAQLASISGDQALRALKKSAMSAGLPNATADLVARTIEALTGEITKEWTPPLSTACSMIRLRALELDADETARSGRLRDQELQTLFAALRRKEKALDELYEERAQSEYLLLRVRHKRVSQKVRRIDDLTAQLERLHSDPAPQAAEDAIELAPRVEKLMAALGEARAEMGDLLKQVPAETKDVEALQRQFLEVQEELSLLEGTQPVGAEIESVVRKVYDEWRRLAAEAEAAEFAANQARADAHELAQVPSDSIVKLSCVTTAEKLRSRLRARTALLHEYEAAVRKRTDALETINSQLTAQGTSLAEAMSTAQLMRTPLDRLAAIQEAHDARREAEKTARLIPRYRLIKRRSAKKIAESCAAKESWLLAELGIPSFDSFAADLEASCRFYAALEPLITATHEVANSAARLQIADEELSEFAGGLSTSDLSSLVDELEDHQNRMAAAIEIEREADVAAEAAKSLKAARDAAATELLVRLRPLGIVETDPAMAWSRFRVLAEGWKRKRELEKRLAEISSRLEPYVELRRKIDELRVRQDDLARRLSAVLSRIEGCDSGSLDERIANFARLRDAALLERKLSLARSQLENQLQEVCRGRSADEWRKELVEIEARLSELEDSHPLWRNIEVASPEAVLEEKISGIEVRIRSAESAVSNLEAEIKRLDSAATGSRWQYRTALAEIRGRLRRLGELTKLCSSLRLDSTELQIGDSIALEEPMRSVAALGSSSSGFSSSHRAYYHISENSAPEGTPLAAYLLARIALLLGWMPENEQLPLVLDGALDDAAPFEKQELLKILGLAAAATQVIVLTTDEDIRALAEASQARVEYLSVQ